MLGPTKRAADMDDLMNLETQVMRLQEENARLRALLREAKAQPAPAPVPAQKWPPASILGYVDAFKKANAEIEQEQAARKPGTQMSMLHLDACIRMVRSAALIAKCVAGIPLEPSQNRK